MSAALSLARAALLAASFALIGARPLTSGPPAGLDWAYPRADKPEDLPAPPPGLSRIPGAAQAFTQAQLTDAANPADWFPAEHPAPPTIVAHQAPGKPTPCAECHLYNGQGFLAAASLAGLSRPYILEQIKAFRTGARTSAEHGRFDTLEMIKVARGLTDEDAAKAAAYFAALRPRPWVRVVETETVPLTRPSYFGWLETVPGGATEPIGHRVIELPEDWSRMILQDPHSGIIDYVPTGALARGAALVHSGGPGGEACRSCHGGRLRGSSIAPPLAGRSAAYLARMLWDMKTGARGGAAVALMRKPSARLTEDQITDIAAYLASLKA
jgi:cytochrome c553